MQEHTQNACNKHMAKKTGKNSPPSNVNSNDKTGGKNVSTSVPNINQFMDEYEQTLLRNQEIDWLNSNEDSFVSKKKEEKVQEKPKTQTQQIPSFWKKDVTQVESKPQVTTNNSDAAYQQKLLKARHGFIQKSSAGSPSNNETQSNDSTNKSNSINSSQGQTLKNNIANKPVDVTRSQRQQVVDKPKQTQTIDLTQPTVNNQKSNQTNQIPSLVPNNGNNSIANKQIPTFNQSNNVPSFVNQPVLNNTQSTSIRPNIVFNINNQLEQRQNNNLSHSNQIFQRQQQLTVPKQTNVPSFNLDLSKAGFRKETWVCALPYMQNKEWLDHRNSLANNLKNKPYIDEKMLDMLAVITFSDSKSMPPSQIQQKRLSIKTFAVSFEEAKQKESEYIMKKKYSVHQRQIIGYSLGKFLPVYQRITPKTIKYNSQKEVKELLEEQEILQDYLKFENQSVQSFLQHYQNYYKASYKEFERLVSRIFQLIEQRKKIEAQLGKLRQQKKQTSFTDILDSIEERQQNLQGLLYKVGERLSTHFDNMPKSDLNYELQDINRLQEQQKQLIKQIESCRKGLEEVKQGHPYKQTTDLLCECTAYLAQRVALIEDMISKILQK